MTEEQPQPLQKKTLRLNLSAWLLLPFLAALAVAAYIVLGGLPNAERSITPDLIRWLVILLIVTLYWGAMVVSAAATVMVFMWEPPRGIEKQWIDMVLAGRGDVTGEIGRNARWLLIRNDIRWCVMLLIASGFFLYLAPRIMAYAGGLGVAG